MISHRRDIDGIASASIISRFEQDAKIYLLDYEPEYFEVIEKIISKLEPCKILVSDLGLPSSLLPTVAPLLEEFMERGFKIIWFDHHIWPSESLSVARRIGISLKIKTGVPAAEIVSQHYGGDSTSSMLAILAREGDYPPIKRRITWLLSHLINHYHYIDPDAESPLLTSLVSKLSRGVLWDAEMQAHMDKLSPRIEKAYNDAFRDHVQVEVSDYIFAISRFDKCIPPVLGAWKLLEHSGSNLAIGYYDTGEMITIRNHDVNVDCSKLAGRFNGGGHTHLAGGKLPLGVDNPENWIIRKLRSEPIPTVDG